jgi:RNA polymerase sigma factor (sigma-70 family)
MASTMTTSATRQIEALFAGGSAAGLSDRQLIERFLACRDSLAAEAAFAALVARHGPMVLGICRRLLIDRQHAEDAFQAVFLVLARRARSVRDPDLLGNWLYGVALRTARRARGRLARMRKIEEGLAVSRPESVVPPVADQLLFERERAEALHAEIDRLPATTRRPVVLCYFEGLTVAEAARRLRCPPGTVHSRLDRAKEKLRRGLLRRGFALPATAMAAMLTPRSVSASISPLLCDSTTRAAIHFATRHAAVGALSAPAAALAQEVLNTMLIHKLKAAALAVLLITCLAGGAGSLAIKAVAGSREGGPPGEPRAQTARTEPHPPDSTRLPGLVDGQPRPAPGRMLVTGRVLDPTGRPMAGVPVDVVGRSRARRAAIDERTDPCLALGGGATDDDGRFRIEAARTSSAGFIQVYAVAAPVGPGSGFGWAELDPDAEQPAAEVRLRPEQVIRGKLVDVSGRPAAGVEVQVAWVAFLGHTDRIAGFGGWGVIPAEGVRAWPKPATTDPQGRFTVTGVGRDLVAYLYVRDTRFARQRIEVKTDGRDGPKELTLALQPAVIIEGRALADDTGQPIPGAMIAVRSDGRGSGWLDTRSRADAQGRFRINPFPGDSFHLSVVPPEDGPYLIRGDDFTLAKGAVKKEVDVKLVRGVPIRGKVTEDGTSRPVAGARVQFFPRNYSANVVSGEEAIVTSRDDGSFQVTVPPGKGHLLVLGPTTDYVLRDIGSRELFGPGPFAAVRMYGHDIIAYEVRAGEAFHALDARLKPGKTVRGRLVGPDGQKVDDASIRSRLIMEPTGGGLMNMSPPRAPGGRFEVHGLDPERATPVYFLDTDHNWGATVELSGRQSGEPITVRLQPCGRAKARLVDPDGKPLARFNLCRWPFVDLLKLVLTPGADVFSRNPADQARLAADAVCMVYIDPEHYRSDLATDAEGRVALPTLIPGAPYRLSDYSTIRVQDKGAQIRKEFTVKPGETLDLGDILIENPSI